MARKLEVRIDADTSSLRRELDEAAAAGQAFGRFLAQVAETLREVDRGITAGYAEYLEQSAEPSPDWPKWLLAGGLLLASWVVVALLTWWLL